jgi:hypothetical protein
MATKSGQKGRYITKVGFYDIYAKDTHRRDSVRGKHGKPQVASTDHVIYHGKKLVEKGFKTKNDAIEKCKELLGEVFREVYNIK